MKKILILIACVSMFAGCRNVSLLTTLPADTALHTFNKVDNEAVMTNRTTGTDTILTKREVKQLKKDSSDVVDFRAALIEATRN